MPESSYYFGKLDNLIKTYTDIDHKNLLFEFKNEKFEERSINQSLDLLYMILIILPLILIFSNDVVFYSEKIERLQNGESIYYICLPDFIKKQLKNKI